jgi:hypothetical protein
MDEGNTPFRWQVTPDLGVAFNAIAQLGLCIPAENLLKKI